MLKNRPCPSRYVLLDYFTSRPSSNHIDKRWWTWCCLSVRNQGVTLGGSFLAHLCLSTMGSFASLSVCLSVCLWLDHNSDWTKITRPKFNMCTDEVRGIRVGKLWVAICKFESRKVASLWVICRWAHFNVKLHFSRHNPLQFSPDICPTPSQWSKVLC